ncbi:thioredoxin family protein [Chitinophaga filiformis]|uniref:Thioredoxin-like domain-containing protein n=1 Tax=Chitinophaga filiformis TaxID=104663 RepID=A0A1G7NZ97_CHIFI|nr:thioredoxin fold domain-containing protein [Chitinophaga filiformis]SDF79303.1 Thioredoxin-like domain-containing protein [Chitinophaga filiformis]
MNLIRSLCTNRINLTKLLLLTGVLLTGLASCIHAGDKHPPRLQTITSRSENGIAFIEDNWDAAQKKAKTDKRLIFVDAYATWCGPCKLLKTTTFKDEATAAFFNDHFVNLSLNVEKGKGPDLATSWKIQGLPTLLVLDASGKILDQSVGYLKAEDLLAWGKQVLAQSSNMP